MDCDIEDEVAISKGNAFIPDGFICLVYFVDDGKYDENVTTGTRISARKTIGKSPSFRTIKQYKIYSIYRFVR